MCVLRKKQLEEIVRSRSTDLAEVENLCQEISSCKESLRSSRKDVFHGVILGPGSKKIQQAGIPCFFISICAFTLFAVEDIVGKVLEVEFSIKKKTVLLSIFEACSQWDRHLELNSRMDF